MNKLAILRIEENFNPIRGTSTNKINAVAFKLDPLIKANSIVSSNPDTRFYNDIRELKDYEWQKILNTEQMDYWIGEDGITHWNIRDEEGYCTNNYE